MVQLVVKEQGGTDLHYLDVSDVSIKGNYSAKEIQDLASQKSDFTQAFTLPFTKVNNDFFSHFYDVVSVDGSFNSSIKCEADIYVDSNIVFSGYLQLLNVNNSTKYYEALVFGVISNIATSLDEKQLNELDLSEFSHLLTIANIKDSWSGNTTYTTSSGQTGEEILYPIADYGYNYSNQTLNGTIDEGINPTKLKPALNVKVLFEKILASIGYTINSTFFATDFFAKQYMTLVNNTQQIGEYVDNFRVGLQQQQAITIVPSSINPLYFNVINTGNLFDLTGNYNESAATPYYDVPISGMYRFRINLQYSFANTIDNDTFLDIRKLNDSSYFHNITIQYGQGLFSNKFFAEVNTSLTTVDVVTEEIFLEQNDQIYLAAFVGQSSNSGNTLTINQTFGTPSVYSAFSMYAAPYQIEGGIIDLSANNNIMPTEKQVDFISAICSRYNLIIEMDKDVTNQLNIEPAQDYFDAGTSKDWSNKIDLNKDVKLKPTNEFRKERILMSDLEDEDRLNYYWQDTYDEVYNSYNAALSGDFGKGELEVKSIFSSWNTTRPQGHNMLIAMPYKWDNGEASFVEIKPRLFAYSGLKSCDEYRLWSFETGLYTTETSYPFCNHYLMSGNTVVSTDSDIRFKTKHAYSLQFYVDSQPVNDTYAKCWRKYLNNIYSEEARILTANFYLTPEDIAEFKYNDKIFVQNSYYRINKITSYALGKNQSTKVELIKIIEGTFDDSMSVVNCDLQLLSTNINGTTTWVNSAGVSTNPTQACCEANNFSFIDNVCYWNTTVLPQEPVPSPIVFNQNKNVNTTGGEVIVGQTASSVVINDKTQIYLEGTVRRIGKIANDKEVLSFSTDKDETEWIPTVSKIVAGTNVTISPANGYGDVTINASGGGGTPASPNNSVQYNDGGSFGGESAFTYNDTSNDLFVTNTNSHFFGTNIGHRSYLDPNTDELWFFLTAQDFNLSDTGLYFVKTRDGSDTTMNGYDSRAPMRIASTYLPIGYRLVAYEVYTNAARPLLLRQSTFNSTATTLLDTATTNTINALGTPYTINVGDYFSLLVDADRSTTQVLGGRLRLTKI